MLEAINAQVPDKTGRFVAPERKSAKEEKADDDLDWLAGAARARSVDARRSAR